MGIGTTIVNHLGKKANEEPTYLASAFFMLIDEVTEEELKSFIEKSSNNTFAVKKIVRIIKINS